LPAIARPLAIGLVLSVKCSLRKNKVRLGRKFYLKM
jgi:hypothetical protein